MTPLQSPPILSSQLRAILARCRIIAVVGLSPQWHRPSHFAAQYMQAHGYRIVPVNPLVAQTGGSILGEHAYASVTEAAQALEREGRHIDMVDCFRRAEDTPPLAEEAVAIGASCLWLQLGVVNDTSAQIARAAGLDVVQDRCVKIEHARLFGGLGWMGVNTRVITSRRARQLPY